MSKYNVELLENTQDFDVSMQVYDRPPSLDGTRDYEELNNKPKINEVELSGNKNFGDLGLRGITNLEIEELLK